MFIFKAKKSICLFIVKLIKICDSNWKDFKVSFNIKFQWLKTTYRIVFIWSNSSFNSFQQWNGYSSLEYFLLNWKQKVWQRISFIENIILLPWNPISNDLTFLFRFNEEFKERILNVSFKNENSDHVKVRRKSFNKDFAYELDLF